MKIKTKSGFVCDVNENKAKDWRFAKHLALCDKENTMVEGIAFVVPFLLGEKGEQALMEHVTDKDGMIPTAKIISEFREILGLIGEEAKKSESSQE